MDPIFTYVTGVVLSLLGIRLLMQAFRLGKAAEGMLGAFLVFAGGGMVRCQNGTWAWSEPPGSPACLRSGGAR